MDGKDEGKAKDAVLKAVVDVAKSSDVGKAVTGAVGI